MGKGFGIVLILFCSLLVSSCSTEERPIEENLETRLQTLMEEMKSGVSLATVNLDGATEITAEPVMHIEQNAGNGLFLSQPTDLVKTGDRLLILDKKQHAIFTADLEGRLFEKMGRKGKGPGEFINPHAMVSGGDYIFVDDTRVNGRIQVFNRELQYITGIEGATKSYRRNIAASHNLFYFANSRSQDSLLVGSYLHETNFQSTVRGYRFMPRLLPRGRQPAVVNLLEMAANQTGAFTAGYVPLPYLYVFNADAQHTHTVQFSGERVERLDKPIPSEARTSRAAIPMRTFVMSLAMDEEQNIYLFSRVNAIYFLEHQDATYTLKHVVNLNTGLTGALGNRISIVGDYLAFTFRTHSEVQLYALSDIKL